MLFRSLSEEDEVGNRTTETNVTSNKIHYSTWINDRESANGTVEVLSESIDVGMIEAEEARFNSIRVVLNDGNAESTVTLSVRSYRQWVTSVPFLLAFCLFLIFKVHLLHCLFLAMCVGSWIVEGSMVGGFNAVFNVYLLQAASDSAHVSM